MLAPQRPSLSRIFETVLLNQPLPLYANSARLIVKPLPSVTDSRPFVGLLDQALAGQVVHERMAGCFHDARVLRVNSADEESVNIVLE